MECQNCKHLEDKIKYLEHRAWMGYWPRLDHNINDPTNCPDCTKFVRAGNTELTNPFGP